MTERPSRRVVVLLDNGHGENTRGKCSPIMPDGRRLYEWAWTRLAVKRIAELLKKEDIEYRILVPEMTDTRLEDRCARANEIHRKVVTAGGTTIFMSIHCNAAGSAGQWMSARGWEAYTTRGATEADKVAECLYNAAKKHFAAGTPIRKDTTDGDQDKEANFYVLKHTTMPAVLTENFFMDNIKDCQWLMSDEGLETCAQVHVEAIKEYIRQL